MPKVFSHIYSVTLNIKITGNVFIEKIKIQANEKLLVKKAYLILLPSILP